MTPHDLPRPTTSRAMFKRWATFNASAEETARVMASCAVWESITRGEAVRSCARRTGTNPGSVFRVVEVVADCLDDDPAFRARLAEALPSSVSLDVDLFGDISIRPHYTVH